jgi:hypothetical protein
MSFDSTGLTNVLLGAITIISLVILLILYRMQKNKYF